MLVVKLEKMRVHMASHWAVWGAWTDLVGEILLYLGWYSRVLNLGSKAKTSWWASILYQAMLTFEILLTIAFPVTIPIVVVLCVLALAHLEVRRVALRKAVRAELAAKKQKQLQEDSEWVAKMDKGPFQRSEWE